MAGIAASLRANPALDVLCVDPSSPAIRQGLDECAPAAVAFDLAEALPDLIISLLRERPGPLLIGLDAASDEVLVLSGHQAPAVTATGLVQVIAEGRRP